MNDDRHDDGLVHSHNWATDAARPVHAEPRATTPAPREEPDEGLVHSHDWASGERGRPAH